MKSDFCSFRLKRLLNSLSLWFLFSQSTGLFYVQLNTFNVLYSVNKSNASDKLKFEKRFMEMSIVNCFSLKLFGNHTEISCITEEVEVDIVVGSQRPQMT
jgi:hypothetical protein